MKNNSIPIKDIFISLVVITALIVVVIVTFMGVLTVPLSQQIGQFRLSTTDLGISLSQPVSHATYLLNGYNDYVVDASGNRFAIVPFENRENVVKDDGQQKNIGSLANYVAAYFMQKPIRYRFIFDEAEAIYTADAHDNIVTVTRTISNYPLVTKAEKLGVTFKYERDDLVFDEQGILYTENTIEDHHTLESVLGITLTRHDSSERRPQLAGKALYIVNPHVSGALVIRVASHQTIAINKDSRIVELEQINKNFGSNTVTFQSQIQIFNSIANIRKI